MRELLTESGSNFRVPPVNFYRALQSREPPAIAQAVALTFMGARAEKWPKDRLAGMAVFFAADRLQIHRGMERGDRLLRSRQGHRSQGSGAGGGLSRRHAGPAAARQGSARGLRRLADQRRRIPGSPATSSIASGIGCWGGASFTSRTTFVPTIRRKFPSCWPTCERELVAAHYDLKHIYRLILNSKTYQLSSIPRTDSPKGEAQFACYPLRRLEAEVLIDALCQITGTTERYSSTIPEPFTFIPGRAALDRPGRRQHQQSVLGAVRPSAARHRLGIGAQQSLHGGPDRCTC